MASAEIRKTPVPGIICLLITVIILIAGLWPFNFISANKVERLQNGNGVRFYSQGMIVSRQPLELLTIDPTSGSMSIELMVRPSRESNHTVTSIVTLYGRDRALFMIGQWKAHLAVRVPSLSTEKNKPHREIGISNVLIKDVTHLITLVSDKKATDIYIDGKLNEHLPDFSLVPDEFKLSGHLLLGNSPTGMHSWNGIFFGLAIYDRTLSDKEVQDHYYKWEKLSHQHLYEKDSGNYGKDGKMKNILLTREQVSYQGFLSNSKKPLALYFFDDQRGITIQDHSGSGNDLLMPQTFHPLHRTILGMPDKGFFFTRYNLLDIAVNILGFIPFGFFLPVWLQQTKSLKTSTTYATTLVLGFCLSLGIELAQAYLPTRDSSLMDVISNTVGTTVGVLLHESVLHKRKHILYCFRNIRRI